MNRRSLLRMFGIGAVVAPIVESQPLLESTVRLIEPAKFELVDRIPDDMPRLWGDRLDQNPFERLWLARWRHEQKHYHVLEHLLDRSPTADECAVVAGLMQWFGTNCGLGFIHDTFRAEGLSLTSFNNDERNYKMLHGLYQTHSREWPEFAMLRMKNGPPELLEAARPAQQEGRS